MQGRKVKIIAIFIRFGGSGGFVPIVSVVPVVPFRCWVLAREDEGKRGSPPYRPYSHRNPSKVIFRSPARSSVPRGLSDSQSYILNFTHVDS